MYVWGDCHAYDMNNAQYGVLLWNAWEKWWVKTKANTVMLASWVRKETIKSVLGTRVEGDMAQQQVDKQGNDGNGGDNDGACSCVQYESDW
jgi:hypothetical protein